MKRRLRKEKKCAHHRPKLGDPTLERIVRLLRWGLPYPTDSPETALLRNRFVVYRVCKGYCIIDDEIDKGYEVENVILPFDLAFNPWFNFVA